MLKLFPFLTSNRFWAVVLIALANYLKSVGFVWDPSALANAIMLIAGGHTTIRTLDRLGEQSGKIKK